MINVHRLLSFFVVVFPKRNCKHTSCFYQLRNKRESLGELKKGYCGNTHLLVFPQHFSLSQTSTFVTQLIETWDMFSTS